MFDVEAVEAVAMNLDRLENDHVTSHTTSPLTAHGRIERKY